MLQDDFEVLLIRQPPPQPLPQSQAGTTPVMPRLQLPTLKEEKITPKEKACAP